MKTRGFEVISTYSDKNINLPKRATSKAAGYDFEVAEMTTLLPDEIKLVPTGIKSYMQDGEVLYLYDRSSNPRKKGLVLINSVGVIDGDYYNNADNEGHIFAQMKNITGETVTLEKGERVVQGVFMPFLVADGEEQSTQVTRSGGFGSTGV
ncbi:MAG: dUTP diphosphatase [Streptococcaceae bacterium]|jgi:dUTP pyrophosphatase|nr:dUTP diphosphatase [Streptococcaceae bacterium]MCL2681053.1 dUTP diphosphatase [Streptococcaceae bacterium]